MTQQEEKRIIQLRKQGLSLSEIAVCMNINAASIRSFCSRNNVQLDVCLQCGKTILQSPQRKEKKFCSDKCRMTWWNHNAGAGGRAPHHTQVCRNCHTTFDCFHSKSRVYCSRKCYAEARRKAAVTNE